VFKKGASRLQLAAVAEKGGMFYEMSSKLSTENGISIKTLLILAC
jgi:hypothetical protein